LDEDEYDLDKIGVTGCRKTARDRDAEGGQGLARTVQPVGRERERERQSVYVCNRVILTINSDSFPTKN
jgi:hypothetical protein